MNYEGSDTIYQGLEQKILCKPIATIAPVAFGVWTMSKLGKGIHS